LLVGPTDLRRAPYNDSVFYYLLPKLKPATRYIYTNPATTLYDAREWADDVKSADVLILDDEWSHWNEPNDSVKYGPNLPNEIVRRDFCPVPLAHRHATSLYHVYVRC